MNLGIIHSGNSSFPHQGSAHEGKPPQGPSNQNPKLVGAVSSTSSMPSLRTASSSCEGFVPGPDRPDVDKDACTSGLINASALVTSEIPESCKEKRREDGIPPLCPVGFPPGSKYRYAVPSSKAVSSHGPVPNGTPWRPACGPGNTDSTRPPSSMRLCLDGDLDTTSDQSFLRGMDHR